MSRALTSVSDATATRLPDEASTEETSGSGIASGSSPPIGDQYAYRPWVSTSTGWTMSPSPIATTGHRMTSTTSIRSATLRSPVSTGITQSMSEPSTERLRQDDEWTDLAGRSRRIGLMSTVLMLLYLVATETEGFLDDYVGLVQRVFAATVLAWLLILSVRLLRVSRSTAESLAPRPLP